MKLNLNGQIVYICLSLLHYSHPTLLDGILWNVSAPNAAGRIKFWLLDTSISILLHIRPIWHPIYIKVGIMEYTCSWVCVCMCMCARARVSACHGNVRAHWTYSVWFYSAACPRCVHSQCDIETKGKFLFDARKPFCFSEFVRRKIWQPTELLSKFRPVWSCIRVKNSYVRGRVAVGEWERFQLGPIFTRCVKFKGNLKTWSRLFDARTALVLKSPRGIAKFVRQFVLINVPQGEGGNSWLSFRPSTGISQRP
jgi:hypothetical protein